MNTLKYKRKILMTFFLHFPYRGVRCWALKACGFELGEQVYIGDNLTVTVGFADKSMKLIIQDRVSIAPNVTLIIASHPNESRLNRYYQLLNAVLLLVTILGWVPIVL